MIIAILIILAVAYMGFGAFLAYSLLKAFQTPKYTSEHWEFIGVWAFMWLPYLIRGYLAKRREG